MQLPLQLVTFEYQNKLPVRTVTINGEPWFVASDVCRSLGLSNVSQACSRLDDDEKRDVILNDVTGRKQSTLAISESGLYAIVLRSDKPEAKVFRKWVTRDVLPQIRKTGSFIGAPTGTPAFIRRFNDNWDRIEQGYFSVISELAIRVYGRLEQLGHRLADKAPDGREIRPDVSVGRTFADYLKASHPELVRSFKTYKHLINGMEVDARQYKMEILHIYIHFVDTVWMREHAPGYLGDRDAAALEYLPRLLPPPDAKDQTIDVGSSKLRQIQEALDKIPDPVKKRPAK